MNFVKLINIICSISICYSLDLINKTKDSNSNIILRQKREETSTGHNHIKMDKDKIKLGLDLNSIILPKITHHISRRSCEKEIDCVLERQKRGQPPVITVQNKLNNDNMKLRLNLNKILNKIPPQIPNKVQQPITNLRERLRPVCLANNRLNAMNRGESQSKCYHPKINIPIPPSIPSKINKETEQVVSEIANITKCAPEPKSVKFYVEADDDDEICQKSHILTPKLPLDKQIKEKVLTQSNKECVDGNQDKKAAIIGIMNQLPEIIKTVMNERIKSVKEGNPIIIKNITEITLPIQQGSEIKTKSQPCDKPEEANTAMNKNNEMCKKEVQNLLLKPILEAKQNDAVIPHLPSHDILANDPENEAIESIEIKQRNYSEIVERKCMVDETEENIQPFTEEQPVLPYTTTVCENLSPVSNYYQNVYDSDSSYAAPSGQATASTWNPNLYNTLPMYTTPAGVYPNMYTPNLGYMKYSPIPPSYNMYSGYKPIYISPTDNGINNIEANNCDDNKNTMWKTWSNTEIVIKTSNNPAKWQKLRPMFLKPLSYPTNCNGFKKYTCRKLYVPMCMNYPQLPR